MVNSILHLKIIDELGFEEFGLGPIFIFYVRNFQEVFTHLPTFKSWLMTILKESDFLIARDSF